MPTTFVNSINSNPIYADRAEKDAAGNTISTTYEPSLPTKTGNANKVLAVNSNADGLVWVAQSQGTTYTAGDGIDLTNNAISVVPGDGIVFDSNEAIAVSRDESGGLVATGALAISQSGILMTPGNEPTLRLTSGAPLSQVAGVDEETQASCLELAVNVDNTTIEVVQNQSTGDYELAVKASGLSIPTIGTTSL